MVKKITRKNNRKMKRISKKKRSQRGGDKMDVDTQFTEESFNDLLRQNDNLKGNMVDMRSKAMGKIQDLSMKLGDCRTELNKKSKTTVPRNAAKEAEEKARKDFLKKEKERVKAEKARKNAEKEAVKAKAETEKLKQKIKEAEEKARKDFLKKEKERAQSERARKKAEKEAKKAKDDKARYDRARERSNTKAKAETNANKESKKKEKLTEAQKKRKEKYLKIKQELKRVNPERILFLDNTTLKSLEDFLKFGERTINKTILNIHPDKLGQIGINDDETFKFLDKIITLIKKRKKEGQRDWDKYMREKKQGAWEREQAQKEFDEQRRGKEQNFWGGGLKKKTKKSKKDNRKIHIGKRGGKYHLINGRKVYL